MMIPDISHYHPVKDWAKVKKECDFLISKATQGTSNIDSTMASFVRGCEQNQINYWLYCYLNKGNEVKQVEHMVNSCKNIVGTYFMGYIIDVEAGNDASNIKAALQKLESYGGKCMIYTMYSQYEKYKSVIDNRGANTAWWEARYNAQLTCHKTADMHQYTSKGTCPGIGSPIDLNVVTGFGKSFDWFVNKRIVEEPKPIASEEEEVAKNMTVIKKGSKGLAVKVWQTIIGEKADGIFGSKTEASTKEKQKSLGVTADGVVGKATWAAALKEI